METPPPYMPRQKSKTNAIVWWIVGAVAFCCVLPGVFLGGAAFWGVGKVKNFAGCMFQFQDVQKGILKYASEHKGKLPNAKTWQDDVRKDYIASMRPQEQLGPFKESDPNGIWGCTDDNQQMTGIAFNSELSGKNIKDIKDQTAAILIFETQRAEMNLADKYQALDFEKSPLIFNKHRGWLVSPVSGQSYMVTQNGRHVELNSQPGSFNVNVSDK